MLECLRSEVAQYKETLSCRVLRECRYRHRVKGTVPSLMCVLCPEGAYSSCTLLLDHVREDHVPDKYFSACGRKILNMVYAIFDNDRFAERRPENLLRRAARLLRDMLTTPSNQLRRSLDRQLVLLLTGKGPCYIERVVVVSREDVLRVGHFYMDRAFADMILQQALLQHGRVRPLIDAVMFQLLQRQCLTTGLLPRRLTAWLRILEAVADSPPVVHVRNNQLAQCLAEGDYRHLTMDATFRLLRRVRGQARFNQGARSRSTAVVPDAEAKHRLLTILGVASTPLGVYAVRNEATASIVEVLVREWTMEQRAAVLSVTVDNPSKSLVDGLRGCMPNLRVVCLDPPHLAFKYEQHHADRRTPGSRVLRIMLAKFWRYDPYLSSSHWGPVFDGNTTGLELSVTEQHYADQLLKGDSMSRVVAERACSSSVDARVRLHPDDGRLHRRLQGRVTGVEGGRIEEPGENSPASVTASNSSFRVHTSYRLLLVQQPQVVVHGGRAGSGTIGYWHNSQRGASCRRKTQKYNKSLVAPPCRGLKHTVP